MTEMKMTDDARMTDAEVWQAVIDDLLRRNASLLEALEELLVPKRGLSVIFTELRVPVEAVRKAWKAMGEARGG